MKLALKGKKWLLSFLFALLLAPSASAQDQVGGPLDLQALVKEAPERNPEVLAAKKKVEVAAARVPQARALPDPQFGIEWENTIDFKKAVEIEFALSQTIPFPGKLRLKGEVAQKEVEQARAEYLGKQMEIMSKVKVAYYQFFLAFKAIEIKQEEIKLIETFSKIAQTKYAVGTAIQQDVLKAQTILATLLNDLVTLEQERETAAAALNTLLNRPPDSPLGQPVTSEVPRFTYTIDQLQRLALENRADLQAARFNIERGEVARALANRQYYPDFSIGLQYARNLLGGAKNKDKWEPTISINIPWLWTRERYDYQVQEAVAQIEAARAAEQAIKNRALFEIKDLTVKIQAAERLANLYKTAILPLATQTLNVSTASYQTGQVDFLTLVDNLRTLRAVEIAYYQSLVSFHQRVADLELTVGLELR